MKISFCLNNRTASTLALLILLLAMSCQSINDNNDNMNTAARRTQYGSFKYFQPFPSEFVNDRQVTVWLPEDYNDNDSTKTYAVLYIHDGQMLFDSTTTWNGQEWKVDETMHQLLKDKKIKDAIVVGIWNDTENGNRSADYYPQKSLEYLDAPLRARIIKDRLNGAAKADNYLKFIVTELKPFIDSAFSTKRDVANTFIAGSSMGGLISMYAFCEYPNVFGGAACISTHWPGVIDDPNHTIPKSFQDYLNAHLPTPDSLHKIYFDYGTETLDQYYEPHQLVADSILTAKGYNSSNWMTQKFEGADHSENSWNKRLHIPLEFLMK